ncbi:MAG: hypothetical protein ACI9LY_000784 [Arenicella sp.]|jgi:hypothetical protein
MMPERIKVSSIVIHAISNTRYLKESLAKVAIDEYANSKLFENRNVKLDRNKVQKYELKLIPIGVLMGSPEVIPRADASRISASGVMWSASLPRPYRRRIQVKIGIENG